MEVSKILEIAIPVIYFAQVSVKTFLWPDLLWCLLPISGAHLRKYGWGFGCHSPSLEEVLGVWVEIWMEVCIDLSRKSKDAGTQKKKMKRDWTSVPNARLFQEESNRCEVFRRS